jgi:cold shock CspA family protein
MKFFNAAKGYGFIRADDGSESFFHISIGRDDAALDEDDQVTFEIATHTRTGKPWSSRVWS